MPSCALCTVLLLILHWWVLYLSLFLSHFSFSTPFFVFYIIVTLSQVKKAKCIQELKRERALIFLSFLSFFFLKNETN